MERFLIFKCPRCGLPRYVDTNYETTKCWRCKKVIRIAEIVPYGTANTIKEAQRELVRFKGLHVFQYAQNLFRAQKEVNDRGMD